MTRAVFYILWTVILSSFFIACGGWGREFASTIAHKRHYYPAKRKSSGWHSHPFFFAVSGTTSAGVSYSVNPSGGGGHVTAEGVYTAPAVPGTYRVRASSTADPSQFAEATVSVRDYATTIERVASPSDAYEGHTATLLQDGSVLVVGGSGFQGMHILAERYRPDLGRWETLGPLAIPRVGHAAAALQDGRVIVSGGYDPTQVGTPFDPVFKSVEIYDPVTSQFSSGPEMTVSRRNHVVTMLRDGRVFTTGGINLRESGFGASSATEIYDAVAGPVTAGNPMRTGGPDVGYTRPL